MLMDPGRGAQTSAAAKKRQFCSLTVNGKGFKVNLNGDGSVKVIVGGMVGPAPSFGLRDRMRRALVNSMSYKIADDSSRLCFQ